MSVLLIAEHNNKELRPFTLNAITASSKSILTYMFC